MSYKNNKTANAFDIADFRTRLQMQNEDLNDLIVEDGSSLKEGPYVGSIISWAQIMTKDGPKIIATIRIPEIHEFQIPANRCSDDPSNIRKFGPKQDALLAFCHLTAVSSFYSNTLADGVDLNNPSTLTNLQVLVHFRGESPKQGGRTRGAEFDLLPDYKSTQYSRRGKGCYETGGGFALEDGLIAGYSGAGAFGSPGYDMAAWSAYNSGPEPKPIPGILNDAKKPVYRLPPGAQPPPDQDIRVLPLWDSSIPKNTMFPNSSFIGNPKTSAVTSVMGSRPDPFNNKKLSGHGGVDIDVGPHLGPLYSIFAGEVIDSRGTSIDGTKVGGFGAWVRVKSKVTALDGSMQTIIHEYGHVGGSYVKVGEQVRQGQAIAAQGNEGGSTGSHLHLNIKMIVKGKEVRLNPMLSLGWPNIVAVPIFGNKMWKFDPNSPSIINQAFADIGWFSSSDSDDDDDDDW